jgi:hypothetical protein
VVVPAVLDAVVRAATPEVLSDAGPIRAVFGVQSPYQIVLLGRPRLLDDAGAEVVLKALAALPARFARYELGNLVPIGIRLIADRVDDSFIINRAEVMACLFRFE